MAARDLPWDGETFGRLKVRGACGGARPTSAGTRISWTSEGFFDTGDVATIDPHGYMQITDRSKDVIKSGGEWISSIDIENLAVGHPDVAEAAVIGIAPSEMGRAAAPRGRAEGGRSPLQGRSHRLPAGPDRQVVAAGRRGADRAAFPIPRPGRSRRRPCATCSGIIDCRGLKRDVTRARGPAIALCLVQSPSPSMGIGPRLCSPAHL